MLTCDLRSAALNASISALVSASLLLMLLSVDVSVDKASLNLENSRLSASRTPLSSFSCDGGLGLEAVVLVLVTHVYSI